MTGFAQFRHFRLVKSGQKYQKAPIHSAATLNFEKKGDKMVEKKEIFSRKKEKKRRFCLLKNTIYYNEKRIENEQGGFKRYFLCLFSQLLSLDGGKI